MGKTKSILITFIKVQALPKQLNFYGTYMPATISRPKWRHATTAGGQGTEWTCVRTPRATVARDAEWSTNSSNHPPVPLGASSVERCFSRGQEV
ncbi:hypothetical protein HPB49_024842 [Dermacentor silvarum]|uniref:Uncharacterized protein n=1 Tax=Dermacentor silvarum TaxID=543639 RepID=A0ACB8D193_DERSI|nr:hypothetical protein HPB49_024842 [Dermacentor silvarum]